MRKYLKTSGLLLIILMQLIQTAAQEDISFKYADTTTYKLYKNESWKELKQVARTALKNDIDYYYLRMRTGIAFYETGQFLRSIPHFKKALEFNEFDPVAHEYIYYALLFSGRRKEAQVYFKVHDKFLSSRIKQDTTSLRNFSIDIAYHSNNENNISGLFNDFQTSDGYQIVPQSFFHTDFLLTHDLSKRVSLSHGGTFLYKKSFYYYSSQGVAYESDKESINQKQYYAGLRIHTGVNSWLFTSLHFLRYSANGMVYAPRGTGYRFTSADQKYNYWSARISFYKNLSLFTTGAGLNYSKLSFNKQYQADLFLSYKPFGNQNLYFTNNLYSVIDEKNQGIENAMFSFSHKAGFRVFDHLWIEGGASYGEIKTLSTNDGFIIFNGEETINHRYDMSFIFPLKKVNIYINGSYLNYSSHFQPDIGDETFNTLEFNGLTIIGGLSWNIY